MDDLTLRALREAMMGEQDEHGMVNVSPLVLRDALDALIEHHSTPDSTPAAAPAQPPARNVSDDEWNEVANPNLDTRAAAPEPDAAALLDAFYADITAELSETWQSYRAAAARLRTHRVQEEA